MLCYNDLGLNAFVKDLWCGTTQVMSGCVSPGGEWLVVGETSGRVTALGLGGDTAADGEDVLPFMLEGGGAPLSNQRQQQEEEESGVRTSRELVARGRFVVRDGVAWEV